MRALRRGTCDVRPRRPPQLTLLCSLASLCAPLYTTSPHAHRSTSSRVRTGVINSHHTQVGRAPESFMFARSPNPQNPLAHPTSCVPSPSLSPVLFLARAVVRVVRVRFPWRACARGAWPRARARAVSLDVVSLVSVGGGEFRCRRRVSRELVREIESKRERGRKKLRGRGLLRDLRGLSPPQKHRKKRGVALRFLSPVLCFCPVLPLCRATVVAIPVTKATRASVDVRARARARSSGVGWVG